MFLIRSAFWLTLVVLLVPIKSGESADAVGIGDAVGVAQAAIHDLGGFCERNPGACETGSRLVAGIALKVQAGARWVYEQVETQFGDEADANPETSPGVDATASGPTVDAVSAGTLTASDLSAEWHGPDRGA